MSNITINNKARTIEINKTFAAASSKYGSPEYKELQDARRDYPDFRVVTIKQKGAKVEFKGLDYKYMEKYIADHDEDGSKMKAYKNMRAISEDGKAAKADALPYADVKDWFLMTYPEIEGFHNKRDELLQQIAKYRAEKQAKKQAKNAA